MKNTNPWWNEIEWPCAQCAKSYRASRYRRLMTSLCDRCADLSIYGDSKREQDEGALYNSLLHPFYKYDSR